MIFYDISERTKKQVEAALLLGFDTVERNGSRLYLRNVLHTAEINESLFTEIEDGDNVSLLYLLHSNEINEIYRNGEKEK